MKFFGPLPLSVWILALMFAFVAPVHAERVLILGDSLSDAYSMPRESGWVYRLDQRLGCDHELIDGSISGDTSAGALYRIDVLLEQVRPHVLIVILGGNDGLRGLSPAELEANLARIIQKGRDAGALTALMQIRLPPNMGPVYIDRFESVYPRLADRLDVPLLPFFLNDLFDRPGMLMQDGIHPTEQAQPKIVDFMLPHVKELIRKAQDQDDLRTSADPSFGKSPD
ncbi:MAG: arylesterase [Wenzhouxiangellaceae bacterium]|nr:arylesterase [Wenzhouxiangellaceae bacterium]